MPVYEYACSACGQRFEELVLGSEAPACPRCSSHDLEKQFSTFGVGATAPSEAPCGMPSTSCGTCGDPRGPGACAL